MRSGRRRVLLGRGVGVQQLPRVRHILVHCAGMEGVKSNVVDRVMPCPSIHQSIYPTRGRTTPPPPPPPTTTTTTLTLERLGEGAADVVDHIALGALRGRKGRGLGAGAVLRVALVEHVVELGVELLDAHDTGDVQRLPALEVPALEDGVLVALCGTRAVQGSLDQVTQSVPSHPSSLGDRGRALLHDESERRKTHAPAGSRAAPPAACSSSSTGTPPGS